MTLFRDDVHKVFSTCVEVFLRSRINARVT